MPGDGPVGSLRRAVADHHHGNGKARCALLGLAARLAHRPTGAQGPGQLAAEFSAALDVKGLIDRLVHHSHLRSVGEVAAELLDDLLGAPAHAQMLLNEFLQLSTLADLPGLRPGPAGIGTRLGGVGPVVQPASCQEFRCGGSPY